MDSRRCVVPALALLIASSALGCSELLFWTSDFDGVRLMTTSDSYSVGDTIVIELVNGSEVRLGYNLCLASLERREASGWTVIPRSEPYHACTLELRVLAPGKKALSQQPVRDWMSAGTYRFRDQVEWPLNRERRSLSSNHFTIR